MTPFHFFVLIVATILVEPGLTVSGTPIEDENSENVGGSYGFSFSGSGPEGNFPNNAFAYGFGPLSDFFEQLRDQQKYLERNGVFSISFSSFSADSNSKASSSITFHNDKDIKSNIVPAGLPFGPGNIPFRIPAGIPQGDGEGAYAGAAISPEGVYQSAQVFPENPNVPNIETRFASSGKTPDGTNFYSVSTSSQSGSSIVDGKKTSFRKAATTVNDNGKVTTYTAQNP